MSIQYKDYTSKKTGVTTRKFYATVYDASRGKSITGPYHDITGPNLPDINHLPKTLKKQLLLDESEIIQAIAAGKVQRKKAGTHLDKVATLWLEASKPPVYSNNTHHTYTAFYNRYIKDVFGDQPINKITAVHVQKYVNEMNKTYSEETVNKCITVLTNIFSFAIEPLHEITTNPVNGIKRAKVSKKKRTVWTDEEVHYFLSLDEVKASPYYTMLCISLLLGARPSEVCGLSESDLHTNPKGLDFYRGYDRYGELSDMKTDGSHRPVPIPDGLYQLIRRQLTWKREQQLMDPLFARNDFMFVNGAGDPVNPNVYSKAFKKLLRQNNKPLENLSEIPVGKRLLPDIPFYNCRHSFATNALEKHLDAALISSVMGNSVKTLLTHYAHPANERQLSLINDYSGDLFEDVSEKIS